MCEDFRNRLLEIEVEVYPACVRPIVVVEHAKHAVHEIILVSVRHSVAVAAVVVSVGQNEAFTGSLLLEKMLRSMPSVFTFTVNDDEYR